MKSPGEKTQRSIFDTKILMKAGCTPLWPSPMMPMKVGLRKNLRRRCRATSAPSAGPRRPRWLPARVRARASPH
eukprot:6634054-Prymnesium_polylepis.1